MRIDLNDLYQDFCLLTYVDSPSFQESEIQSFISKQLIDFGFETEILPCENTTNLYAFKKGNGKNGIILNAHVDVVMPCHGIRPVLKEGKITSSGNTVLGADNKMAVAAILHALKIAVRDQLQTCDIEVLFTGAEEVGLTGAKLFNINKLKYKKGFLFDAGGPAGRIVVSAPAHVTYKLYLFGKSSHAGINPDDGVNAIRKCAQILSELPQGRLLKHATANIGIIQGGRATNIVPDEVCIIGEFRSKDQNEIKSIQQSIVDLLSGKFVKDEYQIEFTEQYREYTIDQHSEQFQLISRLISKLGKNPEPFETNGGSDASVFHQKGLSFINISPGMHKPHSCHEYIYLKDLAFCTELVLEIIQSEH